MNKPKLVFATNNAHKLDEIRSIIGDKVDLLSLADIDCHDDIPETADTLEGNALIKARYIYEKYGLDCFADDTGLEVEALGGAPGTHTARYAYTDHNDPEANTRKLLAELEGAVDVVEVDLLGGDYLVEVILAFAFHAEVGDDFRAPSAAHVGFNAELYIAEGKAVLLSKNLGTAFHAVLSP